MPAGRGNSENGLLLAIITVPVIFGKSYNFLKHLLVPTLQK